MFEQLDYIREEGRLKWKGKSWGRAKNGEYVGHVMPNGLNCIRINKKVKTIAQLVWYHEHGEFPPARLHYKDGNLNNTHISNLSIYKNPLETDEIKFCLVCKQYKDRKSEFLKRIIPPSAFIITRETCKTCERTKANDRARESRQYNHFMSQLEAQEQE